MIGFGIIGAGWRSEFYLRIASLVPEEFYVTGIYIRNSEKKKEFSHKYNVKIVDSIDELIMTNPDFIVSCVKNTEMCNMIAELANRNIPVLSETPIGTSTEQIEDFRRKIKPDWKVQVAEQFHFMPRNQAIKTIIDSGIIGEVNYAELSCCHDYHAVSLIRYFLGIKNEMPKVTSFSIDDRLNVYNCRAGIIEKPILKTSNQKIAILEYKNKTAVYNFSSEQYFSNIRNSRIVIRGTNGEIIDNTVTYLEGNTPMTFTLTRNESGKYENLDGFCLNEIVGNGKILYKNPFPLKRLSDEEIAIATCLVKMKEYINCNKDFYDLSEAITDTATFLNHK